MIFAYLKKHWLARRRQYSFTSWILCIARSLRVLLYYRDHQRDRRRRLHDRLRRQDLAQAMATQS